MLGIPTFLNECDLFYLGQMNSHIHFNHFSLIDRYPELGIHFMSLLSLLYYVMCSGIHNKAKRLRTGISNITTTINGIRKNKTKQNMNKEIVWCGPGNATTAHKIQLKHCV